MKTSKYADAVKASLPISVPLSPQAVALYGKTRTASGEQLADLGAAVPNYGELDVALSSTALVGLDSGGAQLIDYPYNCTEQLSSRLLPLLPLADLAKDFDIELPSDLDGLVASTVVEIPPAGGVLLRFRCSRASARSAPALTKPCQRTGVTGVRALRFSRVRNVDPQTLKR